MQSSGLVLPADGEVQGVQRGRACVSKIPRGMRVLQTQAPPGSSLQDNPRNEQDGRSRGTTSGTHGKCVRNSRNAKRMAAHVRCYLDRKSTRLNSSHLG